MATQAERIKRLETENNHLSAAVENHAATIARLTKERDEAKKAHAKAEVKAQHAADALAKHEAAHEAPKQLPEDYKTPPDEPRWVFSFNGGVDPVGRLLDNQAEEEALQKGQPDTWYGDLSEARDAWLRREAKEG